MKKTIVAGGLAIVASLATGLSAGATPGNSISNSGMCVASGLMKRAAEPRVGMGPAVRDVEDDSPDRVVPKAFTSAVTCSSPHRVP